MHTTVRLVSLLCSSSFVLSFFFNDTATTEIYTLSLHDALPIFGVTKHLRAALANFEQKDIEEVMETVKDESRSLDERSEEHTSELQSLRHLVCRLLLEKKKSRDAQNIR